MKELVRVHKGRMETRYGVDYAVVLDDPKTPRFTQKQIEKLLKQELSYQDSKKKSDEYPGYFDGEVGAYFDYCGYLDIEIPETIVERLTRKKGEAE